MDFTDVYYPGGLAMFVAENDNSVHSLNDLAGRKVAVRVGTKSVEWLREHQTRAQ
ncbi:hypothetical protein ACIPWY_35900 [Streptomyces sp. NPDC090032]|uniref:hypothetical protein n=1 Tax=unclassified Streptomyces TaxID=2593676 RepID=UPI003719F4DB